MAERFRFIRGVYCLQSAKKSGADTLPRLVLGRKPRVDPSHQLDGIINRIAERVFSCGRWPAIQSRQSSHQEHCGDKIDQFLSAFVHRKLRYHLRFTFAYRFSCRRSPAIDRICSAFPRYLRYFRTVARISAHVVICQRIKSGRIVRAPATEPETRPRCQPPECGGMRPVGGKNPPCSLSPRCHFSGGVR